MPEPLHVTRKDGRVILDMSVDDWLRLLTMLERAGGALIAGGSMTGPDTTARRLFFQHLDLLNRLNAGNERWTPYNIPEEFRHA